MSERETAFEDRLRAELRAEVRGIRPRDGLAGIQTRTAARRRRPGWAQDRGQGGGRGWWMPLLSGVAAMALIVVGAALVRQAPQVQVSGPGPDEDVAAAEVDTTAHDVTVWVVGAGRTGAAGALYPRQTVIANSASTGMAAVEGLLAYDPSDGLVNAWNGDVGGRLRLEVNSVERVDRVVRVDFSGPVQRLPGQGKVRFGIDSGTDRLRYDPRLFPQQLVRTVQSTLGVRAPVLVTRDGEPVDRILSAAVDQPIEADDSAVAGVYVTYPDDGARVEGPLRVSGESNTFEANVVWRVRQGSEVVRSGSTMGGSYGDWAPFRFRVDLSPGDYTLEVFEASAQDGSAQYVNTRQVTVE